MEAKGATKMKKIPLFYGLHFGDRRGIRLTNPFLPRQVETIDHSVSGILQDFWFSQRNQIQRTGGLRSRGIVGLDCESERRK